MFRSIWSKSFRDYRMAILGWSNFLGMAGVAVALLVISLVQFRYAYVELG